MEWYTAVRERHLRRGLFFILIVAFIYLNWGYSLDSLHHMGMISRTKSIPDLDDKTSAEISRTIIAQGYTISNFVLVVIVGLIVDRLILWFDYDCEHRENDLKLLRHENEWLVERVRESNVELEKTNILVSEGNLAIPKYREQLAELGFEFEKLQHKTEKKKSHTKVVEPTNKLDLFDRPTPIKPIKKARFKRRSRPRPEF